MGAFEEYAGALEKVAGSYFASVKEPTGEVFSGKSIGPRSAMIREKEKVATVEKLATVHRAVKEQRRLAVLDYENPKRTYLLGADSLLADSKNGITYSLLADSKNGKPYLITPKVLTAPSHDRMEDLARSEGIRRINARTYLARETERPYKTTKDFIKAYNQDRNSIVPYTPKKPTLQKASPYSRRSLYKAGIGSDYAMDKMVKEEAIRRLAAVSSRKESRAALRAAVNAELPSIVHKSPAAAKGMSHLKALGIGAAASIPLGLGILAWKKHRKNNG